MSRSNSVDDAHPSADRLISDAERRHRDMLLALKQDYLTDRTIRRALEPARRSMTCLAEIRRLFG